MYETDGCEPTDDEVVLAEELPITDSVSGTVRLECAARHHLRICVLGANSAMICNRTARSIVSIMDVPVSHERSGTLRAIHEIPERRSRMVAQSCET